MILLICEICFKKKEPNKMKQKLIDTEKRSVGSKGEEDWRGEEKR